MSVKKIISTIKDRILFSLIFGVAIVSIIGDVLTSPICDLTVHVCGGGYRIVKGFLINCDGVCVPERSYWFYAYILHNIWFWFAASTIGVFVILSIAKKFIKVESDNELPRLEKGAIWGIAVYAILISLATIIKNIPLVNGSAPLISGILFLFLIVPAFLVIPLIWIGVLPASSAVVNTLTPLLVYVIVGTFIGWLYGKMGVDKSEPSQTETLAQNAQQPNSQEPNMNS